MMTKTLLKDSIQESLLKSRLDSYSYRVQTPDGTLFIFIDINDEGRPVRIQSHAGKTGNSLAAWAYGTCALINELLVMGVEITKIINLLSNITTSGYIIKSGARVYAGPDAFKSALLRFVKDSRENFL